MSWPCINPDCTLDRGHGTACQPFTTHTFTDLELAARDARIRADIAAEVLAEAADAIQALHPGEVKNSVTFLRDRAATLSTAKADG